VIPCRGQRVAQAGVHVGPRAAGDRQRLAIVRRGRRRIAQRQLGIAQPGQTVGQHRVAVGRHRRARPRSRRGDGALVPGARRDRIPLGQVEPAQRQPGQHRRVLAVGGPAQVPPGLGARAVRIGAQRVAQGGQGGRVGGRLGDRLAQLADGLVEVAGDAVAHAHAAVGGGQDGAVAAGAGLGAAKVGDRLRRRAAPQPRFAAAEIALRQIGGPLDGPLERVAGLVELAQLEQRGAVQVLGPGVIRPGRDQIGQHLGRVGGSAGVEIGAGLVERVLEVVRQELAGQVLQAPLDAGPERHDHSPGVVAASSSGASGMPGALRRHSSARSASTLLRMTATSRAFSSVSSRTATTTLSPRRRSEMVWSRISEMPR
jgi:hypothetical protein